MTDTRRFRFFLPGILLLSLTLMCFGALADESGNADVFISVTTGIINYSQYTNDEVSIVNTTYGTVQVASIPDGAVVTLDEIYADTTPATFANIPAGIHIVEVVMPGYQPWVKKVTVVGGKAIYVDAKLSEADNATGSITVITSPAGADIYIDDVYRGYTPKTIGNLAPGEHTIRLESAGELSWSGKAIVVTGENTILSEILSEASLANSGAIFIASNPVGAAVYLDGNFVGITYGGDTIDINNVSPGMHDVTIRMSGYHDYTTQIDVPASTVVKVNPTLILSQIPHPSGQIQFNSAPEGAAVYLDGKFHGYTPLTLQDIEVGQHDVRLKMPGKTDYHDIIRVTAYQTAVVDAVMIDETKGSGSTVVSGIFGLSWLQNWVHTTFIENDVYLTEIPINSGFF